MEVRKGFVFTIDAMFAIVIVATILINSYTVFTEYPKELNILDRYATDILFVLDENGTVASLSNTSINRTIAELIPRNIKYMYNVTYFNVSITTLYQDLTYAYNGVSNESTVIVDVRAIPVTSSHNGIPQVNLSRVARTKLGISI